MTIHFDRRLPIVLLGSIALSLSGCNESFDLGGGGDGNGRNAGNVGGGGRSVGPEVFARSTPPAKPVGTGNVLTLTDSNFAAETAEDVVLVDFWAVWCGPCRTQGPIVDEVARDVAGFAKVGKLDVDHAERTAGRHGIQGIPTLILFRNGRELRRFVGLTSAGELRAAIAEAVGIEVGERVDAEAEELSAQRSDRR